MPLVEAFAGFEILNSLVMESTRELDARHGHGGGGLFERSKGAMEVYGHIVGRFRHGVLISTIILGNF